MSKASVLEAEDADFETSEDVEIVPSFDSMGLKDELLRGTPHLYATGLGYWVLDSVPGPAGDVPDGGVPQVLFLITGYIRAPPGARTRSPTVHMSFL